MHDLEIAWPSGTALFTPTNSPVRIGRSRSANITLTNPSVSRLHLELIWDGETWIAKDHSTHGCFDPAGVRLPPEWKLENNVSLRLGGAGGDEVILRPRHGESLSRFPFDADGDQTVVDVRPLPPPNSSGPNGFGSPSPGSGSSQSALFPGPVAAPEAPVAASPPSPGSGILSPQRPDFEPGSRPGREPARPVRSNSGSDPNGAVAAPQVSAEPYGPSDTQILTGSLKLSVDNRDFGFDEHSVVTIGRDPSCTIQLGERHALVSRRHLKFYYYKNSWWMEDSSSKGTFVDGQRLRSPYRVQGAFVAYLGDDDAGTPVRVITSGKHRKRRGLGLPLALVGGICVLVALTWLVMSMLDPSRSGPNFEEAKQSSAVLISDTGIGSGFFVADDLIVTNQHVAALSDQLFVGVTRTIDDPAVISYVAQPVASHPYLDIAVLKVVGQAELSGGSASVIDEPFVSTGIPPAAIGSSSNLTLGDGVYSVGFPEQFWYAGPDSLPAAAPTEGDATAFDTWPGCDNPNWQSYLPTGLPDTVTCAVGGDIRRGQLIATMTTGRGASGSPVYFQGEVIAVVFAGDDTPNKAITITTDSFSGWLDQVIAANSQTP